MKEKDILETNSRTQFTQLQEEEFWFLVGLLASGIDKKNPVEKTTHRRKNDAPECPVRPLVLPVNGIV